jgi:hypothetical protein
MTMTAEGLLKMLLLGIGIAGVVWLLGYFSRPELYIAPFRTQVEAKQQRENHQTEQRNDEPASNQPQAPGFRERDIKKYQGEGFRTY